MVNYCKSYMVLLFLSKKMRKILHLFLLNYCLISGQFSFSQCVEGDCNNGFGKYLYSNGDVYVGEFKEGKITGKGKFTWSNGEYYEGSFVLNKRWGYGKDVMENGDVYEGDFLNNSRHGFGRMNYSNGEIYEGNWVSGMRTGKGKKIFKNGEIQEGDFVNGELKIVLSNVENSTYCITGNCINGFGSYKWPEGNTYKGQFKYSSMWGKGEKIWTNGTKYDGEWICNERTGKGIYYFTNGDIYEGEFVKDKITGFGVLTRANGDKNTGYFVENKIIFLTDKQIANNIQSQSITNNDFQIVTSTNNSLVTTSLGNVSSTNNIAKDADGKVYKSVIIGNQSWMAENLNTSKFRNGDPIPEAKTDEEWIKAAENKQPAWCYLDNNPENSKYGRLYNWYAVNDPRGLAPNGWHIPSEYEWEQLSRKTGGSSSKLKANGIFEIKVTYVEVGGYDQTKWVSCSNCSYWTDLQKKNNPCAVCRNKGGKYVKTGKYIPKTKERREEIINTIGWDGNNELGFNAFPYGTRGSYGKFYNKEWSFHTSWWSSKDYSSCCASYATLSDYLSIWNEEKKGGGLSVRCIKD
jgi:uncharacterized protein (TIGR02145 family)